MFNTNKFEIVQSCVGLNATQIVHNFVVQIVNNDYICIIVNGTGFCWLGNETAVDVLGCRGTEQ